MKKFALFVFTMVSLSSYGQGFKLIYPDKDHFLKSGNSVYAIHIDSTRTDTAGKRYYNYQHSNHYQPDKTCIDPTWPSWLGNYILEKPLLYIE